MCLSTRSRTGLSSGRGAGVRFLCLGDGGGGGDERGEMIIMIFGRCLSISELD